MDISSTLQHPSIPLMVVCGKVWTMSIGEEEGKIEEGLDNVMQSRYNSIKYKVSRRATQVQRNCCKKQDQNCSIQMNNTTLHYAVVTCHPYLIRCGVGSISLKLHKTEVF